MVVICRIDFDNRMITALKERILVFCFELLCFIKGSCLFVFNDIVDIVLHFSFWFIDMYFIAMSMVTTLAS